ncbi:MAG: glycoside hydrolase family 43 protein [Oscillospiraceae bacterium]|nr:glycoside hydrolase family 43 protein [Oscillospiraceae bacterium]
MLIRDIQIRDPFVFTYMNDYYLYGSTDKDIWKGAGTGFEAYKSKDLTEWEGPFPAFRPPESFWGTDNFWAPEVFRRGPGFYMFASFIGEGRMRGTAVLRAKDPCGPFRPWSYGPVTPRRWMCLDGTLFMDEEGKPWVVFCHEWVQTGDGTVCASRLNERLTHAASPPVTLFASSDAPWSRKTFSPRNNIEGYVTDGCFPYRLENGKLLMLWSCVGEKGYCLGYAISDSGKLFGPWRQAEEPLFAADGGHGMLFRTRDRRLMLALHQPNQTPLERAVFLEMQETGDELKVRGTG